MTSGPDSTIYDAVPGGTELVRWFGEVPTFHDAEILSLCLCGKGPSILTVRGWITIVARDGFIQMDKHAVVTFTMEDIVDLELDGFSAQNGIDGLFLRYALERPDRRSIFHSFRSRKILRSNLNTVSGSVV